MKAGIRFKTVDQYISIFAEPQKSLLRKMRESIARAAPEAEEVISYNMPACRLKGIVVYYAGYKEHIGFYPTSSGIEAFKNALSGYETSKGAIRFPLTKPLPLRLVKQIVKFRVRENMEREEAKAGTFKMPSGEKGTAVVKKRSGRRKA